MLILYPLLILSLIRVAKCSTCLSDGYPCMKAKHIFDSTTSDCCSGMQCLRSYHKEKSDITHICGGKLPSKQIDIWLSGQVWIDSFDFQVILHVNLVYALHTSYEVTMETFGRQFIEATRVIVRQTMPYRRVDLIDVLTFLLFQVSSNIFSRNDCNSQQCDCCYSREHSRVNIIYPILLATFFLAEIFIGIEKVHTWSQCTFR
jgi:hypothetical protein